MSQDDTVRRREAPTNEQVLIVREHAVLPPHVTNQPHTLAQCSRAYCSVCHVGTELLHCRTLEELHEKCIELGQSLPCAPELSLWLAGDETGIFRRTEAGDVGQKATNDDFAAQMRLNDAALTELASCRALHVKLGYANSKDEAIDATIVPLIDDNNLVGIICAHDRVAGENCEALELYAAMVGHGKSALNADTTEVRLQAVLDAMVDCVHVVDRDMNVRLFNKTFQHWSKVTGNEINPIGKNLFEAFPFLDKQIAAEYTHVLETGEVHTKRETYECAGHQYVADTRKIPVISDGQVTRILTILRDISDETLKRQRNECLNQLSIELANATSIAEAYSCTLNAALAVSQADAGIAWMRGDDGGLSPLAVQGLSATAIGALAYQPPGSEIAAQMLSGSASFVSREGLNGEPSIFSQIPEKLTLLAYLPIRHAEETLGCLTIASSRQNAFSQEVRQAFETIVTQLGTSVMRLQTQQELQQSVKLYTLLTESISDIICILGLDLHVQHISPSIYPTLGYAPDEVIGKHIREFMTVESSCKAREAFEREMHVLRTTDSKADYTPSFEFELLHRNGNTVWGELTTAFVRLPGQQVTGILAVIRDVTERKRSEEGLRRRDGLLQAVASAGEELLRNPNWNNAMEKTLEILGIAAGIDQAYVYGVIPASDDRLSAVCQTAWSRDTENAIPPDAFSEPIILASVPKLSDALLAGEVFTCTRSEAGPEQCDVRAEQGVLSMAAVPLYADGELWGFICFVDCHEERVWQSAELDALRSAASVLSASIQQQCAKQALHAHAEEYRELVQNAKSKILRLNTRGEIEFANDYACDFFGYELEELLGRPVIGTITPEMESSGRDLAELLTRIHTNPDAYAVNENENIKRNGERVWIAWTNRALHDADGNLTGILCIGNDVTVSRRAAEELRWHKRMSDQSSDHIALIDSDYRYKAVNATFPKLFGMPREEIIGCHIAELLGWEYFETTAKPMLEQCFAGYEVESEAWFTFPTPDRELYVHLHYVPYIDDDGQISGVVVTGHDITERKRMEEDLEEANRFANDVMGFANFGITVLDRELRYVVWNPFMEQLTGLLQREVIGRKPPDLFANADEQDFRQIVADIVEGQSAIVREVPYHVASTGRSGWTVTQYSPYKRRDGELVGIIGVVQDITRQRQFEQHQQELAKLESIGALAGGLAHDFNNHLMAILGNVTLARMQLCGDAAIVDLLNQAEQACGQARNVTRQLLTFAKGGEPVKELISLEQLIRTTAGFTMSGAKAQCILDISEDLWPAEVDEGQINQVIQNLLINATQAMPDGGEIKVTAKNIHSTPYTYPQLNPGPYVCISVVDEGIGIPPQHIARIFEPYFSTKQMGSGLGLATSHSIVTRHGGCIEVASTSGEGTTFEVYLPAAADVTQPITTNDAPIQQGSGRVLLMDDDELVRRAAAQLLKSLGYMVETVPDGLAAIELYKHAKTAGRQFDLVIFDLTVPGKMGGEEAIQELHRIDPDIKAIATSGYVNNEAMASHEDYGFAAVIAKPYTVDQLARVVSNVLQQTGNTETA